jgi:nitrite reductase/ring-hydroxylating ferredoxin subunit
MSRPHPVAKVSDVPVGAHVIVQVRGREIGLFNVGGDYYALPNACFHQNGPLCAGAVSGTVRASAETGWKRTWTADGEIIVCPWHALEFEIKTGQCVAYPQRRLPTWKVTVDGDTLSVWM